MSNPIGFKQEAGKAPKEVKSTARFSYLPTAEFQPTSAREQERKGFDYFTWGDRNEYPLYLWNIYSNCATLQSVINGSVDFTLGDKINNNTSFTGTNDVGDSLEDVVRKCAYDRWIFGGWAVQIHYDSFGVAKQFSYVNIMNCRLSVNRQTVYLFPEGKHNISKTKIAIRAYNPDTAIEDGTQIYYCSGGKGKGYYPVPDYSAALVSAETQIEIQKFHFNAIINGFMAAGVLNFNNAGDVADEVKEQIEAKIMDKWAGTANAAKVIVAWNEDKDKAMTFERITEDQFDERYQALADSTRENIFISMRALPVLFGLTIQTGFNTQEYDEAFRLYSRTAIKPKQIEFTSAFTKITGVPDAITFDPFTI